jgi:hypothetical protein
VGGKNKHAFIGVYGTEKNNFLDKTRKYESMEYALKGED